MTDLRIVPDTEDSRSDIDKAFDNFQQIAEEFGLPKVRFFPPHPASRKRVAKMKQRLAEVGLEGWNEALEAIGRSSFLRGSKGFRAHFDFMLQPESLVRMIEGFYDD